MAEGFVGLLFFLHAKLGPFSERESRGGNFLMAFTSVVTRGASAK